MNKVCSIIFFITISFKLYAAPVSRLQSARILVDQPTIFLGKGVNIPSIQIMNAFHYKIIKAAGFDHVRIPIHPFSQTTGTAEFQLRESFLAMLDTAVNRSLANGLIPIIDFHEHNAMQKDPLGTKPMFLAIWDQIAIHYKDSPSSVLFEVANEPNMKAEIWNEILNDAHAIIRKSNPNRTLLIGTINGNQIKYLKDLKIPKNDKNVIVTIHYYMPIKFTHQGAQWSKNYKDISGLTWPTAESGEQEIIADFNVAAQWSKENGIALHLGEFGTYSKSAMDSR
ncbi:MAG: glycoside hydrolase family 5 protein, partial [Acinetobacter sp.]